MELGRDPSDSGDYAGQDQDQDLGHDPGQSPHPEGRGGTRSMREDAGCGPSCHVVRIKATVGTVILESETPAMSGHHPSCGTEQDRSHK